MSAIFTYKNPIYSEASDSIRDCQIIPDGGRYYLTGTCPPYWKGPNPGIKLYSSDDLLHWRFESLLISRDSLDETAWYRDRFWAPEIHKIHGKFYLGFNCRNDSSKRPHSCGLAVADHITGPYTVLSHDRPLIEDGNDLTLFVDDDQRTYALWATAGRCISGQEINPSSGTTLGEPFPCLTNGSDGWDSIGIEGPYVIKRNGVYFLFYSSWSRGYEIGYATAPSVHGPWTKAPSNPLFGAQEQEACARNGLPFAGDPHSPYIGVGHNAVFTVPDGRDWLVCHYQEKGRPESLGFDPIEFDRLSMKTQGPSHAEVRVVVRSPVASSLTKP